MVPNISIDSVDSDVFFVEQVSNEPSPQRNNSMNILNSTELSQTHTAGMPSVSSIATPEPTTEKFQISMRTPTNQQCHTDSDGSFPILPPNLNDLNLPPVPFNILATMVVVNQEHDDR